MPKSSKRLWVFLSGLVVLPAALANDPLLLAPAIPKTTVTTESQCESIASNAFNALSTFVLSIPPTMKYAHMQDYYSRYKMVFSGLMMVPPTNASCTNGQCTSTYVPSCALMNSAYHSPQAGTLALDVINQTLSDYNQGVFPNGKSSTYGEETNIVCHYQASDPNNQTCSITKTK